MTATTGAGGGRREGHGRLALVTGASAGIGAAFADVLAERGYALVLTARRADRLEAVAAALRAAHGVAVHVLPLDLAEPAASEQIGQWLDARGVAIDVLVNNAGYGVPGRYLSKDWRVHGDFLQVMITAVGELTHLYLPAMEAAGHGRILNIASLAGLVPASAGHTMYGATKAWLIRFSECLALESASRGVHVTALCPGFTYSEFHDVNGMREKISKMPKMLWLSSEEVARLGVDAVEAGKTRVVTGTANKVVAFLSKYLPDGLARALVASKSKDYRDAD